MRERACIEPFDELHADGSDGYGGSDDAVHVERLEPEHLLDAEPGHDLSAGEHHPEDDP